MTNISARYAIGCIALTALTGSPAFAQGGPAPPIPRTNWTLQAVDSQELEVCCHAATNAFDGDPNSFWATRWFSAAPSHPHEIQINLGAVYAVSGFRYLPRQDGAPQGRIGQYEFYVSMDGATWGTAVASGTFPNTAAEQQVLFPAKSGRYVRLRALTEVDGRPWTTVAELNVLGTGGGPPPPPPISQESWTLQAVDSQELEVCCHAATNAFDGDPNSFWATRWFSAAPSHPHEIQIDLGAVYAVSGFWYLPRQDGAPQGRIGQYEFYVSMDGATWGTAVALGTFPNTAAEQQVLFPAKSGRYVRLRALTEVDGRPWTTVAELNVLATGDPPPTDGDQSPDVSLAAVSQGPYIAPASIALRASAHDQDGTVTRVDFYAGSTHVGRETAAPYDALVPNLGVGTYVFVAVAADNSGNTAVSNSVTLTVTVGDPQIPGRAVFGASSDHNTLVEHYVLQLFAAGSDPSVEAPVAALDLGKPAVTNGECDVDISALIVALNPGTYIGTVTAVGDGGMATSAPSPPFNR